MNVTPKHRAAEVVGNVIGCKIHNLLSFLLFFIILEYVSQMTGLWLDPISETDLSRPPLCHLRIRYDCIDPLWRTTLNRQGFRLKPRPIPKAADKAGLSEWILPIRNGFYVTHVAKKSLKLTLIRAKLCAAVILPSVQRSDKPLFSTFKAIRSTSQ